MYTWSDEQLRAIEADRVIVSASAGSGKTTLMIERVLRLVRGGVPVERMLVVTFASAQAEDMRAKLERGLAETLAGELTADEREAVRRAKYRLAGANISTLHAFCAELLRAYFYVADVEADFVVSSGADTELRRGAACEAAIREMQKRGDPDFDALYDALSVNRGHLVLKNTVFRVSELIATMPDPEDVWRRTASNASAAERELARERAFAERSYCAQGERLLMRAREAGAGELADYLCGALSLVEFGRAFTLPVFRTPKRYADAPVFCALVEEMRAWKTALGKAAKSLLARDFSVPQPLLAPLETLVRLYGARYAALKAQDGVLDFNDLERKTLEILRRPDIAEVVRKRYDYLFVDEYQDVNPMQLAILTALEGKNVFLVGDVKQSIYAFRLCDPDIFRARYAEMSAAGEAVDLNCNYRTAAPVLEFCNYLFAALMTEEFGGADYANRAMFRPARPAALSPAVEVHLFSTPRGERSAGLSGVYSVRGDVKDAERGVYYREGRLIADRIKSSVGKVVDGKNLSFCDMAVLLRDMKGVDGLLAALTDSGIPVATRQDYRLLECAGVKALADLLRVLANPKQDWPLLSVLRSPLFDFTETELAEIRLFDREKPESERGAYFYQACEGARAHFPRLQEFYDRLAVWRGWATYLAPAEVLRRVIAERNYYGGLLARADGAAQTQLVRIFAESVADSRCGSDLATYLAYLDDASDITVEVTDGAADAVTVTTMHKSKGLEYGVVFLARLGKNFSGQDRRAEVYVDREFGVVMKSYDRETRSKDTNALRDIASCAMDYRSKQEELRLLYVACTRAKYKLYLIGSGDYTRAVADCAPAATAGASTPMNWILSVLQRDASKRFPFEAKTREIPPIDYAVETHERKDEEIFCPPPIVPRADETLTRELRAGFEYRYPFRGDIPAKETATNLNDAADADAERGESETLGDGDAAALGNAYHHAMQAIRFDADAEEELRRLDEENLITAEERTLIDPERIRRASAAFAAFRPIGVRRELPFLARFAAADFYGAEGTSDTAVLVQGIVDLLLETEDGCILVDYKTARGDAEYLRAKYARQLRIYASACERAGYRVRRALIWSFPNDEAVEIPLS